MEFTTLIFYILAVILIFAALRVVTTKNPVHAVLYLVLAFFTSAGVWLLLQAEFLAVVLVLVYVGAVMVLFLFVVMMLDINSDRLRVGFWQNLPVALIVAFIMVLEMILILTSKNVSLSQYQPAATVPANYSNVSELGRLIYTHYLLPFEIAAVILLLAMVAAIGLTIRTRKGVKKVDPSMQIKARKQDRVRLVKMEVEIDNLIPSEVQSGEKQG